MNKPIEQPLFNNIDLFGDNLFNNVDGTIHGITSVIEEYVEDDDTTIYTDDAGASYSTDN